VVLNRPLLLTQFSLRGATQLNASGWPDDEHRLPLDRVRTRAGWLLASQQCLTTIMDRGEMLLRTLVPADPRYLELLRQVSFYPNYAPTNRSVEQLYWEQAREAVAALLATAGDQL
jgi:hypothetical protein